MRRSPSEGERPGAGPPGPPGRDKFEVFIVGFGNPMRGDDGVGQEVARLLEDGPGHHEASWSGRVLSAHQLTPEMAEQLQGAHLAVFIDAVADGRRPGSVSVTMVEEPPAGAVRSYLGCWQDLTPRGLLSLCRELYGYAPPGVVVSVTVASTAAGYGLSSQAQAAVPLAAAAVRLLIAREHPSLQSPTHALGHPPTDGPPTDGPPTDGPPTDGPPTDGPRTELPAVRSASITRLGHRQKRAPGELSRGHRSRHA